MDSDHAIGTTKDDKSGISLGPWNHIYYTKGETIIVKSHENIHMG